MDPMYFDLMAIWIVIDGGPCAGKSTCLVWLRQYLEDRGYRVIVIEESATKLISRGFSPFGHWYNAADFQKHVLRAINNSEREAYEASRDLPAQLTVFLCDRGAAGGAAYCGKEAFQRVAHEEGFSIVELKDRYRMVIHLVTAADGAQGYYTLENNAARSESPERARELDQMTREAWYGHRCLRIIDNSTDFAAKIRRAINELGRVLEMPESYEIEQKFLVLNVEAFAIPQRAVIVDIVQDYLIDADGYSRRVRKRVLDGVASFYYTEKQETEVVGKRVERERTISFEEYQLLLQEKDPSRQTIHKTRTVWTHGPHTLEWDTFQNPPGLEWLVLLEVETPRVDTVVSLPPGLRVVDVTKDPNFSNASIAGGSLHGLSLADFISD